MSNYVTVAQIQAEKGPGGRSIDLTNWTDAQIQTKIDEVEAIVESITGDIFYTLEAATYKFDGNYLTFLPFPPKVSYALLSVDSVKNYDTDQSTVLDTYTEHTDFEAREHWLELIKGYPEDSARRRFRAQGKWPKGQLNIWVTGDWGASSCPEDIKRAVKLLTLEHLSPGSMGLATPDVMQMAWADLTVTYKTQNMDNLERQTGFLEVDRLLSRHINYSSLMIGLI